ncbi:MAG: VOC family protein [Dehalococcoidia bacterium]
MPIAFKVYNSLEMGTPQAKLPVLPPVEQLGFVVSDMKTAVEHFRSILGCGPFTVYEHELKGVLFKGEPSDCRLRMATAYSGDIEIELIEVLEGETPHTEFLRENGEGLQHVRFRVGNLEEMLGRFADAGIVPVWQHNFPEYGVSFAYLNTDSVGGVMFELIEIKGGSQ